MNYSTWLDGLLILIHAAKAVQHDRDAVLLISEVNHQRNIIIGGGTKYYHSPMDLLA